MSLSFFTDHSDSGSAGLAVQQAKEIVRGNIAWLDYNESLIEKWMNEYLSFLAVPDLKVINIH